MCEKVASHTSSNKEVLDCIQYIVNIVFYCKNAVHIIVMVLRAYVKRCGYVLC